MASVKLHPGARWIFRQKPWAYFVMVLGVVIYYLWSVEGTESAYSHTLMTLVGAGLLVGLLVSELYARKSYERWSYELTPNHIVITHGVIQQQETTIPYDRIQNVNISRGPLARLAGFATLEIQTAGNANNTAEGTLPAVSPAEAERLRTLLMKGTKSPVSL